jgi:hypothetical protein
MINFKQHDDVLPSTLIVLAILILAGTWLYLWLVPTPSASTTGTNRGRIERKINDETMDITARAIETRKAVAPRLWLGDPITITSAILAQLTAQTRSHFVTLKDFRPDKSQPLQGMTELRYDIDISGPYADVRAVLASLDAPGGKVALRSIQLAASQDLEASTDTTGLGSQPRRIVSATAGLSAYEATDPDLLAPDTGPDTDRGISQIRHSRAGASINHAADGATDGTEVKHGSS